MSVRVQRTDALERTIVGNMFERTRGRLVNQTMDNIDGSAKRHPGAPGKQRPAQPLPPSGQNSGQPDSGR